MKVVYKTVREGKELYCEQCADRLKTAVVISIDDDDVVTYTFCRSCAKKLQLALEEASNKGYGIQ